jgi:hypothetical protein
VTRRKQGEAPAVTGAPVDVDETVVVAPPDDAELHETLKALSADVLRGEPVPPDLAALWRAQFAEDVDLLDAYEMVLLEGDDTDLFADFTTENGIEAPVARAFERMTTQVRWVAEVFGGELLGYWVGDRGERRVADAPVVRVDTEGQFELAGRTLAEALLEGTDPDDPDDVNDVVMEFRRLGVPCAVDNHDDIYARIDSFDEPNGIVLGYVVEERMRDQA